MVHLTNGKIDVDREGIDAVDLNVLCVNFVVGSVSRLQAEINSTAKTYTDMKASDEREKY
jgi:hypothetical protein